MSITTTHRIVEGATYVPPVRDELLAEGLRSIVAGRPLPEALRPAPRPFPDNGRCPDIRWRPRARLRWR